MLLLQYGPHQASHQPQLTLTGTPLTFNPAAKFLGVTFDRTLSFGSHVQSLRIKFFPRFQALRSIASASWGPSREFLSQLYKVFIRPAVSFIHTIMGRWDIGSMLTCRTDFFLDETSNDSLNFKSVNTHRTWTSNILLERTRTNLNLENGAQVNPNQTCTAKIFWAGAKPEPESLFEMVRHPDLYIKLQK